MGFRIKLFGLLFAIAITGWGNQERKLASLSRETPTKLSCKQLGAAGPGDNAHVVLTDFALAPRLVYDPGKSGDWKQIWVPAVALDGDYVKKLGEVLAAHGNVDAVPLPKPITVIITSEDVPDQKAFDALDEKEELEGLVVNSISHLSDDTKRLLENSYGDVSNAQILHLGRKPAHRALAYAGLLGGPLLGLFFLLSFFRRKKPAA
jgi:hypothetical protein